MRRGAVKPTGDLDRFKKNSKNIENEIALQEELDNPEYADAYKLYPINFDDAEIQKEFARNGQDAEYYRKLDSQRAKYSARNSDNFEKLSSAEYRELLHKDDMPVTAQEFRMISSQRMSRYSRAKESDVPALDIFRIGDYRVVNDGYVYVVRNQGKYDFTIVLKEPIRADIDLEGGISSEQEELRQTDRRNGNIAEREGSRSGRDLGSGLNSQNGGTLREDDRYLEENTASGQRISNRENSPDSGRGYLKNSLRNNTEGVSNRSLLANALESAAQNDIERKKLTEYKGKIEAMLNAEKRRSRAS